MEVVVVVVVAALEEAVMEEEEEVEEEEEDYLVVRVVEVAGVLLEALVQRVEMGLVGEVGKEVAVADLVMEDVEAKVDVP